MISASPPLDHVGHTQREPLSYGEGGRMVGVVCGGFGVGGMRQRYFLACLWLKKGGESQRRERDDVMKRRQETLGPRRRSREGEGLCSLSSVGSGCWVGIVNATELLSKEKVSSKAAFGEAAGHLPAGEKIIEAGWLS